MRPAELSQAAMTAALMGGIAVVSIVIPYAVVFAWLGAVPMGVLNYRHRLRAAVAAAVAASLISFLVAGFGGLVSVLTCVYMGAISGQVKRHGRGAATMLMIAALWGVLVAGFCVGVFAALTRLREVVLSAVAANVGGFAALAQGVPPLTAAAAGLNSAVHTWLQHWPWFIGVSVWLIVMLGTSFGWRVLTPVLRRLQELTDLTASGLADTAPETQAPAPLPVTLDEVGYRYADTGDWALAPMTLQVSLGEHVAVTGANGAGKSTLMRILAGAPPTAGTVQRPGGVGLGQTGGTALVFQHPESQVLGLRVADDLVWGLSDDRMVDTDGLLAEVGLSAMGDRDTAGLSGGELQRLAVASALAREPALLVADEVTTMVDQDGRRVLMRVLDGLTSHHRLGLVHITHYPQEADAADRIVRIGPPADATPAIGGALARRREPPEPSTGSLGAQTLLQLHDVSHDYAPGTPWSTPALRNVSLRVNIGEGVLLCGGNGSGKSTLAWIISGLLEPTAGQCLLDGHPTATQVGAVALCFQAARLQLLRGHVGAAVAALAGLGATDTEHIDRALESVGLPPDISGVLVDRLSGGQLRRVALGGLLARAPRLLVLDEPLAGLDVEAQANLIELLIGIREQGQTIIVISHDTERLSPLCPRTIRLERGGLISTEQEYRS